eukprot:446011-Alexandrium_andersonii.AAC.1
MGQLVRGKGAAIAREFQELLADDTAWEPLLVGFDDAMVPKLAHFITAQVLHHAAAWDRRVMRQLLVFPFALMRVVASQPHVACAARTEVATQVLATPLAELDDFTLKLRLAFRSSFVDAASQGTL